MVWGLLWLLLDESWFKEQISLGNLITLLTLIVAGVAGYVKIVERLKKVEEGRELNRKNIFRVDQALDAHLKDKYVHLDIVRDEKSYRELMNRLDKIDAKHEKLETKIDSIIERHRGA